MEIDEYILQIVATVVAVLLLPLARTVVRKIVRQYGVLTKKKDIRIDHMVRIFMILINITFVMILIAIWGVSPQNMLIALSSVFAVIGVALFAQWSLLSNMTAGIIVFFNTPFRIGDRIRIMDKDMPVEAEILDIHTFYTHLKTDDGELVVYPNSLLMQKGISVIGEKK